MRMGMRITLLGVVLCCAFLQRPAAASDAMSDVMRLCKGRSEMAELVMRFRQLGTSAASMMEKFDVLPALKDGDSHYWRSTSRAENV